MKDCIDREVLLKDISKSVVFTVRRGQRTSPEIKGANKVIDRIKNAPTADIEEVKHGEWVKKMDEITYWYECSECGERVPKNQWKNDYFSMFCPGCGAKMDGRKEK